MLEAFLCRKKNINAILKQKSFNFEKNNCYANYYYKWSQFNLLGEREKEIYGNQSFETYLEILRNTFKDIAIDYFQSNIEGEIINKLHEIGFTYDGIILNAGGYTHTSVAIAMQLKQLKHQLLKYIFLIYLLVKIFGKYH